MTTLNSQEHIDMMMMFERIARKEFSGRLDKEAIIRHLTGAGKRWHSLLRQGSAALLIGGWFVLVGEPICAIGQDGLVAHATAATWEQAIQRPTEMMPTENVSVMDSLKNDMPTISRNVAAGSGMTHLRHRHGGEIHVGNNETLLVGRSVGQFVHVRRSHFNETNESWGFPIIRHRDARPDVLVREYGASAESAENVSAFNSRDVLGGSLTGLGGSVGGEPESNGRGCKDDCEESNNPLGAFFEVVPPAILSHQHSHRDIGSLLWWGGLGALVLSMLYAIVKTLR